MKTVYPLRGQFVNRASALRLTRVRSGQLTEAEPEAAADPAPTPNPFPVPLAGRLATTF